MPTTKFLIPLVLCVLFLAPAGAFACSCMPQGNILERKAVSDMVFAGRLVSETVDSAQGIKKMRFAVQRSWRKGKRQWLKQMRVETSLGSAACGFEMKVGDRAIIFATAGKENGRLVYRTNLCSENIVAPTRQQADSLGMKAVKPPPRKSEEN